MTTNDWFSILSGTKIHHLYVTTSDHKALWMVPEGMKCSFQKPFWFKQTWMTDQGCSNTVEAFWRKDVDKSWGTKTITMINNAVESLHIGVGRFLVM